MINDTVAAISTPLGSGGVAVIRVSGPAAIDVAKRMFQFARSDHRDRFEGYSVHYGYIQDPATLEKLDDGLLTVFRAPASYTGEDTVEISCHGGVYLPVRVLNAAISAGARIAAPGEFTYRAFMNGKLDLAQAEAVADLVRSRTDAMRRTARRDIEGRLSHLIGDIRHDIVGIVAAIEASIDFSDEVGELDYEWTGSRLSAVLSRLELALSTTARGRILREGLRVAIVGRPNVGKSSLLNALLGADRAIVTSVPGTTRDLIEESIELEGAPVVFVDTAGIRDTADEVEKIGIERAIKAMETADVILHVVDAASDTWADAQQLADMCDESRTITVLNKMDLVACTGSPLSSAPQQLSVAGRQVSALTGTGIDGLRARIAHFGGAAASGGDGCDSVLVTNSRHVAALREAHNSLAFASKSVTDRMPGDFVCIDIRGALDALGQITGETVEDEVLHRIFQDFCVGK